MAKSRMCNLKLLVLIFVLFCVVIGCTLRAGCVRSFNDDFDREAMAMRIRQEMKPLDFSKSGDYAPSVVSYFDYYKLGIENSGIDHIFGTFRSGDETLAAHIFRPKQYKGAVIVLHGYFDHCGQLNRLIKYLLQNGYAVAAFDLPGLGLSSGQRGAIDDFSQYCQALLDFTDKVKPRLKGPYHLKLNIYFYW